jgi:hypothetical protein
MTTAIASLAPGIVPSPIVYMTRQPQSVIRDRPFFFDDLRSELYA